MQLPWQMIFLGSITINIMIFGDHTPYSYGKATLFCRATMPFTPVRKYPIFIHGQKVDKIHNINVIKNLHLGSQ